MPSLSLAPPLLAQSQSFGPQQLIWVGIVIAVIIVLGVLVFLSRFILSLIHI